VIATTPADSQVALTLGDAGVVVPPDDAAALAEAIESLCDDSRRRRSMGQAALRIARGLTIDATLGHFEKDLVALAGDGR
jgi:colanic acid biosynthesis glycosyl transferase WcaI